MRCLYLKEANVKQCSNSAWRKMIVQQAWEAGDDKCLSPAHANCAVYRRRSEAATSATRCPYLEEKLAEYCARQRSRRWFRRPTIYPAATASATNIARCSTARTRRGGWKMAWRWSWI